MSVVRLREQNAKKQAGSFLGPVELVQIIMTALVPETHLGDEYDQLRSDSAIIHTFFYGIKKDMEQSVDEELINLRAACYQMAFNIHGLFPYSDSIENAIFSFKAMGMFSYPIHLWASGNRFLIRDAEGLRYLNNQYLAKLTHKEADYLREKARELRDLLHYKHQPIQN